MLCLCFLRGSESFRGDIKRQHQSLRHPCLRVNKMIIDTKEKAWKRPLRIFASASSSLLVFGSLGLYVTGLSFCDALWCCVTTATCIGYGDVALCTIPQRFLSGVIAITGVAVLGCLAAAVAEYESKILSYESLFSIKQTKKFIFSGKKKNFSFLSMVLAPYRGCLSWSFH